MSHLHVFSLLTAEEIANSPTQRDGWSASKEESVRKKAARIIYETSKKYVYPMSAGTAAMAVTLFVRFYSRKSMVSNHPFVIALASLFLAGKLNDEPRSLNSLMVEMLKQWYGRTNPELREMLADPEKVEGLRNTTVDAEQVLMITLEFDLNVDLLVSTVATVVKHTAALEPLRSKKVQQFYINLCNDAMLRDSTLVLQYSAKDIALAICNFYFKFAKNVQAPEMTEDGKYWYEEQGLSVAACEEIYNRFVTKLYVAMGSKGQKERKEISIQESNVDMGESSKATMTALVSTTGKMSPRPDVPSPGRTSGVDSTESPGKRARAIIDDTSRKREEPYLEETQALTELNYGASQGGFEQIQLGTVAVDDDDESLEEGEIR
eukprot:jgi/Picsp_1/4645/NSC_02015-R1_-related cyclin family protein